MTTEEIILSHSHRGMDVLKNYLPLRFVRRAARRINDLPRGKVLLTTGFFVDGHPETDGPPGTVALASALRLIGFDPVIITDAFCVSLFVDSGYAALVFENDFIPETMLTSVDPVCLISAERCGINADGIYANMLGADISEHTAPVDRLFTAATEAGIYTVGIGDGGNEIGMGNLRDVISCKLNILPCVVETTDLIISDVSNWGAYALCAELGILNGKKLLPEYKAIFSIMERMVAYGFVDGVTKKHTATEDGYPPEVSFQIINSLLEVQSHGTD